MDIEELEKLARDLKSDEDENINVIAIFKEFAKNNNIGEEELEILLSKKYDCFKCESCNKFYSDDEYSYFDEVCIYCNDVEDEDEEF